MDIFKRLPLRAGFHVVAAIDFNKEAVATLRSNLFVVENLTPIRECQVLSSKRM